MAAATVLMSTKIKQNLHRDYLWYRTFVGSCAKLNSKKSVKMKHPIINNNANGLLLDYYWITTGLRPIPYFHMPKCSMFT